MGAGVPGRSHGDLLEVSAVSTISTRPVHRTVETFLSGVGVAGETSSDSRPHPRHLKCLTLHLTEVSRSDPPGVPLPNPLVTPGSLDPEDPVCPGPSLPVPTRADSFRDPTSTDSTLVSGLSLVGGKGI